jgi:hypothetical protein
MKRWWEERFAIYRPSNISYTALGLTIAKLKNYFLYIKTIKIIYCRQKKKHFYAPKCSPSIAELPPVG